MSIVLLCGVGSLALTLSYNKMVRHDMFNLFSEAVAYESGKNPEDISEQRSCRIAKIEICSAHR